MEFASRRYPSFSSTLLDQMYRSIDNDEQSIHSKFRPSFEDDACFIHKKPLTGRKSAADDLQMRCAAATQSFCTPGVLIKPKPIPIRRGCVDDEEIIKLQRKQDSQTKPKDEGKTRMKTLKILYGDLKKVKQPISPGGRLATFLNSLFFPNNNNNNNNKKKKKPTTDAAGLDRKSKSANASTCSSASSVSRSCTVSSNIPSSTPNLSKRSVRFYQPSLHQHQTNLNKLNLSIDTHKNRHISEAARNLLNNYQKKVEFDSTRNINAFENQTDDVDDDDDDARSDSSSDLFELENLSASRYREELPVYETTRLDTNPLFM